jgi:FtsP/CotA-like multicopper oxidase with cupredoxin domain
MPFEAHPTPVVHQSKHFFQPSFEAIMHSRTDASTFLPRRDALKWLSGSLLGATGLVASCGGGGGGTTTATTEATTVTTTPSGFNALWIPPLLTGTVNGGVTTYELVLAASSVPYQTGARTATYGYNGNGFWGPTLVLKKGSTARMQVKNSLTEDTTTHWHGMLVPGPVDGGPHQVVTAGATWLTDAFTVKNHAST